MPASYDVLVEGGLDYPGKHADQGATVDDLPGMSIGWLLEQGLIAPHVDDAAPAAEQEQADQEVDAAEGSTDKADDAPPAAPENDLGVLDEQPAAPVEDAPVEDVPGAPVAEPAEPAADQSVSDAPAEPVGEPETDAEHGES